MTRDDIVEGQVGTKWFSAQVASDHRTNSRHIVNVVSGPASGQWRLWSINPLFDFNPRSCLLLASLLQAFRRCC